ncbi:MAG: formate C-acetyltransferase/glycerol dehydratase family glycyl radical enzyme [Oscillospiraceae bacterium]|jgi:formate C-acetyltransferase|nr:formate C-acetyltransferase/glycerol dehydratase family glycyl radical enzyme [Oscillospiraceae bacterium]
MSDIKTISNSTQPPLPVEPWDREWGVGISGLTENPSPFERVNKLLRWTKDTDSTADAHRANIVTEVFEKYPMYPQNIKWALALREVYRRVPINIWDDELVVGELAAPPNAAPLYPEFSIGWLSDEVQTRPLDTRKNDRYVISEQVKRDIIELGKKWQGKTVSEATVATYTEQEARGSHLGAAVLLEDLFIYAGVGHVTANYEKLFSVGFGGLRREAEERMNALDMSLPESVKMQQFYTAEVIIAEGASTYIRRYGELARDMAAKCTDSVRKAELERISSNCLWVAENPPRDFWEAIQLYHLATNMIIVESSGHSVTYGRFDVLFTRFYENDIKNKTLSREQMQELIELFFVKMHQLRKIRDKNAIFFSSGTIMGGTALDVGGVDRNGKDITSDVSFMVLDAHAHTRIPNPWMGVRLHENSPEKFRTKVFNVIRIGTGEPKIFNDAPMIQSLLNYGRSLEDARDYVGVGCVEPSVPGKTYGWHDSGSVNLTKIMQLAINGGKCIGCSAACPQYKSCVGAGKTLGPDNGSIAEFTTFDEVLESYDAQMKYWCDTLVTLINKNDVTHQRLKPLPYLSLLIDGCLESGADISTGSAEYNASGPQGVGIGTASDSLVAVKQLVFDEKRVSGEELLAALGANWVGYEPLYQYVNSDRVHHYGNDDDYADDIARFVMSTYCKYIEHRPTAHGGEFMPGVFSVTNNVMHGSVVSATPDGRLSGEPVSDCIGPVHTSCCSHDTKGPTAVANSVAKLDHSRIGNGIILNWKFAPTAVSGETGRDNLIALMDGYYERGGMQSQFSIVGRETMLAAQKEPEQYKDLVVRIAGYSAYFVELSENLQNDLIGRTELSFD